MLLKIFRAICNTPTNAFETLPNVQKLDNYKGQGNNSVIKLVVPSKCTNLPTHSSNLSCSFIKFNDSLNFFSILNLNLHHGNTITCPFQSNHSLTPVMKKVQEKILVDGSRLQSNKWPKDPKANYYFWELMTPC
jgi:hypothetical protein